MSAQNIGDPAVMQAIATLFGSLNGQQLASFIDQLNVATAQNNTTVEVAGPGVVNTPVGKNATSAPAVARGGNTGSRRKGAQGNGKLRALNSFMTFRSKFTFKALTTFLDKSAGYYSTLFAGQTQKVKSGLIRFLWAQDCLKSKWAMLAKAYSSVRDNHMGEVNLESFLRETTPLIVVIPANAISQPWAGFSPKTLVDSGTSFARNKEPSPWLTTSSLRTCQLRTLWSIVTPSAMSPSLRMVFAPAVQLVVSV